MTVIVDGQLYAALGITQMTLRARRTPRIIKVTKGVSRAGIPFVTFENLGVLRALRALRVKAQRSVHLNFHWGSEY